MFLFYFLLSFARTLPLQRTLSDTVLCCAGSPSHTATLTKRRGLDLLPLSRSIRLCPRHGALIGIAGRAGVAGVHFRTILPTQVRIIVRSALWKRLAAAAPGPDILEVRVINGAFARFARRGKNWGGIKRFHVNPTTGLPVAGYGLLRVRMVSLFAWSLGSPEKTRGRSKAK